MSRQQAECKIIGYISVTHSLCFSSLYMLQLATLAMLEPLLGTITNVAFFYMILIWVLFNSLKLSKHNNNLRFKHKPTLFASITVLFNGVMSILNVASIFYDYSYTTSGVIGYNPNPISLSLTWVLATLVSYYSMKKTLGECKRFPIVLILWWVFATIIDIISLSLKLAKNLESMNFRVFLLENIVGAVSLPILLLLCINALPNVCTKEQSETEQRLLEEEFESTTLGEEDEEAFTKASLWSLLTFTWLNPIFKIGRIQKLEHVHVPCVPHSETAAIASSMLKESIHNQALGGGSLAKAIILFIWKSMAFNAVLAGVNTIASYIGPLLISNFVNFLLSKNDNSSNQYGLIIASILFLSKTVESLSQRQWYFGAQRIGIRVHAALMAQVYSKSLMVKGGVPVDGNITNLINVDIDRIGDFCNHMHGIWLIPVQTFLALIILCINLGWIPSLVAFAVTTSVMVCNTPLAIMQKGLQSKIMEATDARMKMTSETIKNMGILKLHSWELTFMQKLLGFRDTEMSWVKKFLHASSAVATLFWTTPTLVSVFTFGACILVKTELTAATVLSALATFRILQEPIYNMPELISMITQTKVSVDRIHKFIEKEDQNPFINRPASESSTVSIEIKPAEYAWETNDKTTTKKPTITIKESFMIKKGHKVAICGPVGSGKSSLLLSMLGEIPLVSGTATEVYGTKSYVPQSPWIQSGTVRENILFGKKMDSILYENVLDGCALNHDIKIWRPYGDLTTVEERGINLSGGQKQRIQLARAVYNDSDIYFLDDPFSAVDAHTGSHLFKECLMKLLCDKTVVYATHQMEFLEAADVILVMKDGQIVESGSYRDLIACPDRKLVQLMAAHKETLQQIPSQEEDDSVSCNSTPCPKDLNEIEEQNGQEIANDEKRTREEDSMTGRVKWSVYSTFVTLAYKGALVPVILLCQILFQAMQMGSNYWISWAAEQRSRNNNGRLIGIFALLSGGSSIFILGRTVLMTIVSVETARRLYHGMTTSVFRAPISFFDNTPSSRILSRSSTDQTRADSDIPYRLAGLVFALIQLLSIIVLMSHAAWQVLLVFFAIFAISIWYQVYYTTTARELARMVGIRKTPILHHFSESIAGATTIRCFNQENIFLTKAMSLIDDYSRVAFHNYATMEWLSVRINFLFNLVFYFVLVILVTLPRSSIDSSLAGLVATYGLSLNVLQAWVIWNLCNVENKMISVERILQFSAIPSEAPLVIQDCRPAPEWPSEGKIKLNNLHIQYDPAAPFVLKGVTCDFPGRKKIGVVGRTGSGKSTMVRALFRVVEPLRGCIVIDGVNISNIGLHDLRSKLGIIPQDPTLFLGTVRTNLDPLEEQTDEELWEVLRKCHLAELVRQDPRLLDAPVAENGENWSLGQRQLVCLARLLLNKRRILVLDEATASIDTATDSLIQKTIREETSDCTVITVAHRIPTVIDNDMVLVLDEGRILDYGNPARLLRNQSSSFSKLVSEFSRRSSQS